jgi:hypothetical protein
MRTYVRADAWLRPCGRIRLSTRTRFSTVGADGKNPSVDKNASAG